MGHLDHCLAYLDKLPPAISGSGGHNATFRAACECVRFGLTDAEALAALRRYNARCSPQWSERELQHKLDSARRKATPGEKAGRSHKSPIKPRTAAELAARTARRKVPLIQLPVAVVDGALPANARWLGDFNDFMAECHPGPRLSIQMVALWQSYHEWCSRNDYMPMTAADFFEWLKTTCTISRDAAHRFWVHGKDYEGNQLGSSWL